MIPIVAADTTRDRPRKNRRGGPYDFMRRVIATEACVSVELQQVVSGGNQAPFRASRGPALRLKRSIRRFALIWAKTGSTMHWRLA
jgi:hypothetical protein